MPIKAVTKTVFVNSDGTEFTDQEAAVDAERKAKLYDLLSKCTDRDFDAMEWGGDTILEFILGQSDEIVNILTEIVNITVSQEA